MSYTQGKIELGSNIPTNLFIGGLRVARCDFDGDENSPEAQDNARRIRAIWNACAKFPTELIEGRDILDDLEVAIEAADKTTAPIARLLNISINQAGNLMRLLREWYEHASLDNAHYDIALRTAECLSKPCGQCTYKEGSSDCIACGPPAWEGYSDKTMTELEATRSRMAELEAALDMAKKLAVEFDKIILDAATDFVDQNGCKPLWFKRYAEARAALERGV